MKIGVPTMGDRELEETVSGHFGRAPTFTVVDTSTNEVNVLPNTSEHFGVEVYVGVDSSETTVGEAIRAFQAGLLHEATDKDACDMHKH